MLKILKISLLVVIVSISQLFGASESFIKKYNYETNYEIAIEKAKKLNRSLMIVVSTQTCHGVENLKGKHLKKRI